MPLYLLRHAQAADRHRWLATNEGDALRPLTPAGMNQAAHLAARLGGVPVPLVLSSTYLRCVQTVEPLASALGLAVTPSSLLAEGSAFAPVIELLGEVPDHTVLCSHGDVIPDVISALYRRGMEIATPEDWRTATTWVIERGDERFTRASVIAPPAEDLNPTGAG